LPCSFVAGKTPEIKRKAMDAVLTAMAGISYTNRKFFKEATP